MEVIDNNCVNYSTFNYRHITEIKYRTAADDYIDYKWNWKLLLLMTTYINIYIYIYIRIITVALQ